MCWGIKYRGNGRKNQAISVVAIFELLTTNQCSAIFNPQIVTKVDALALLNKYFDAC